MSAASSWGAEEAEWEAVAEHLEALLADERRRADHLEEELSMYHRGANMQEAISLTRTVLFNQERSFMRMVFFKVWKRILSILRKPMITQAMSQVCFQQAFLIF